MPVPRILQRLRRPPPPNSRPAVVEVAPGVYSSRPPSFLSSSSRNSSSAAAFVSSVDQVSSEGSPLPSVAGSAPPLPPPPVASLWRPPLLFSPSSNCGGSSQPLLSSFSSDQRLSASTTDALSSLGRPAISSPTCLSGDSILGDSATQAFTSAAFEFASSVTAASAKSSQTSSASQFSRPSSSVLLSAAGAKRRRVVDLQKVIGAAAGRRLVQIAQVAPASSANIGTSSSDSVARPVLPISVDGAPPESSSLTRSSQVGPVDSAASVLIPRVSASSRSRMKRPISDGGSTRRERQTEIRPGRGRGAGGFSDSIYNELLQSKLDLSNISIQDNIMRKRIGRLQKVGTVVKVVFNRVTGVEEERLVDRLNRIISRDSEVNSILEYFWAEGHQAENVHLLGRRVSRHFAGIGHGKVEMWYARMANPAVRAFPVPFTATPVHILASRPMERVIVDCTHMHTVTHNGTVATGMVSFLDLFSRKVFARPIIAECSWEVCRAFLEYVCNFGVPEIVHTDNGAALSGDMCQFAQEFFGCHIIHGRPRWPRSQAPSEKSHQLIKKYSYTLAIQFFGDILRWPDTVGLAMREYNLRQHEAFNSELTPFMVFFGRADNSVLAEDFSILNGKLRQISLRVQSVEEKQSARLAGSLNLDRFLGGREVFNVATLSSASLSAPGSLSIDTVRSLAAQVSVVPTDSSSLAQVQDAENSFVDVVTSDLQELIDDRLLREESICSIGYTEFGVGLVQGHGAAISELLEFYRLFVETFFRKRSPNTSEGDSFPRTIADLTAECSQMSENIQKFAAFATELRRSAASLHQEYLRSVDSKTRKKMPSPYAVEDMVWLLSFGEIADLCSRYQHLTISTSDHRLKERLPARILRVDLLSHSRPYKICIFVDGWTAFQENRSRTEEAWVGGTTLAPQSAFTRKLRYYGTVEQIPGYCSSPDDSGGFCLRHASPMCSQKMCEVHCHSSEKGNCGRHRRRVAAIFA